jgi:hypothetical protein
MECDRYKIVTFKHEFDEDKKLAFKEWLSSDYMDIETDEDMPELDEVDF